MAAIEAACRNTHLAFEIYIRYIGGGPFQDSGGGGVSQVTNRDLPGFGYCGYLIIEIITLM